jgi:hypothetical protein
MKAMWEVINEGYSRNVPASCARYIVDLVLRHGETQAWRGLMSLAIGSGSLEAVKLIHEAGCPWTGDGNYVLRMGRNPDLLRYALDHMVPSSWDAAMEFAIFSCNLQSVKLLYEKGYEQHRSSGDRYDHPAHCAIRHGTLEIFWFAVDRSGPPQAEVLRRAVARRGWPGGVEMLRYMRKLGCEFDAQTTERAARRGDLEALRYAHMSGAPWNVRTLEAAVWAGSLPCLKYAHMHGCPQEAVEDRPNYLISAGSLPILRYVYEHMDAAWAARMLETTARSEAGSQNSCELLLRQEPRLDWQLVLYLGQKLGPALPEALTEAVAIRKERAAALAGVFWKAGQLQRAEEMRSHLREAACGEGKADVTHADAERMAMWEAMARVPKELREHIALEAHLIVL